MSGDQIKVLVLDDDPNFTKALVQTLRNKNCVVKAVSEYKEALTLLLREVFHVAFIDCILQLGQGVDFVRDIRQILGNSVEIIMMSGVVTSKSFSNYVDSEICDFLSKPISDKELEISLDRLRNKVRYGESKSILTRLFTKEVSDIEKIKFLISLNTAKDYEFFLYINSLLESGESFKLEFFINNKQHSLFCDKGSIIDYESENTDLFFEKLLSKNLLTSKEISQLRGLNQKTCESNLLKNCILSVTQIMEVKYDLLTEVLKTISPEMDISFHINLEVSKRNSFNLLNRNEYADFVFFLLNQKFNNQLFSLFDKNIMDKTLIFNGAVKDFLPEVQPFLLNLKSGMKLKAIYNKYINDQHSFCTYILYILLKGNIYFSESSLNIKYHHLHQRYKSLFNFMEKTKSAKEIFSYFSYKESVLNQNASQKFLKDFNNRYPVLDIDSKIAKTVYFDFVKYNHPDKFPFDLPEDILSLMNKTLLKMQSFYDFLSDPELKLEQEKQKKKKVIEQEMIFAEKKKIFERYMEHKNYAKAFSLLKTIPKTVIDKEIEWQFLYLFLYYESKQRFKLENNVDYLKNIQKSGSEYKSNKLYHQILGLHYEQTQDYQKAKRCFLAARSLDPSFQSAYFGMDRCARSLLREKHKNQPLALKFIRFLKETKEKKKEAG